MMAKRPKNRFQSAGEVRRILEPLAQRKPVEFDFEGLLKERAKVAEQRLATESILRGDSRTTAVSKLEIGTPPQLKKPEAETVVRKQALLDDQQPAPD
jgi:hypothetical protein